MLWSTSKIDVPYFDSVIAVSMSFKKTVKQTLLRLSEYYSELNIINMTLLLRVFVGNNC